MKMNAVFASLASLVVAAGIMAIGCGRSEQGAPRGQRSSGQAREIHIAVTDKGFEPAEVKVPSGRPMTLVITRKTDQTCATAVEFASLNVRDSLPLDQPVRITLPAGPARTVSYECGMHMLGGKIIVQ